MEARGGRYYRDSFQWYHGVTQGGTLSSRILNILVGVIFCHWVVLVSDSKVVPDSFGYMVAEKEESFYADDGLLDSTKMV